MQVKGRIFPYPVLNHNPAFSAFKGQSFDLKFEPEENEASLVLKGLVFSTESKTINELFYEGKIGVCLVVECPLTVYRKSFQLSSKPKDIILYKSDFSEEVCVSLFAYAKEAFEFASEEFDEDYSGIRFPIEKYDIIAACDGFRVTFAHDEGADNFTKSIFSIIPNPDNPDGPYSIDLSMNPRKITLVLSKKDFGNYQLINAVPNYREVFFCMLLIPSLQEALNVCLNEIQNEGKTIDDVWEAHPWFRSITKSYKRHYGKEITEEDLKPGESSQLAQVLLGKPFGMAMEKLLDNVNHTEEEDDE